MPEPSYAQARTARKGPQVRMGEGIRRVEPGDPGTGRYNDRIKIEPKIGFKEPPPKPSDTELHNRASTVETKI